MLVITETKIEGHEISVRLADFADPEAATMFIECRVNSAHLKNPGSEDEYGDPEDRALASLHQAVLRWIRDATKPEIQRLAELGKRS